MKKRSYMHMYISIWTLLSPRPRRRQLAPLRGTQPHPAIQQCSARPELRV